MIYGEINGLKKYLDCKVIVPLTQQPTRLPVAFLINKDTRTWKIEMVRELFPKEDALIILNTPLSHVCHSRSFNLDGL